VTSRTRAIIPVHYAGRPANMQAFRAITDREDLVLIEDAAHAVETVADGEKIGTTADFSCFSFYATKNLTTGEGGMLTTSSAAGAEFARVAALHGMSRDAWNRYGKNGSPHYDVVMPGYKYNMMDLQAAIGLQQLDRLHVRLARREAIWSLYDEALAGLPITLPAPPAPGDVHARHLYTILVTPDSGWTRDALAAVMAEQGIVTSIHFRALHLHPYYQDRFGLQRGMFPNAEYVSDHTLSLPLSGGMTDAEAGRVIDVLRGLLPRG
jgi:dTDP-4-amino-4,6-dideoxygalactose transaminase